MTVYLVGREKWTTTLKDSPHSEHLPLGTTATTVCFSMTVNSEKHASFWITFSITFFHNTVRLHDEYMYSYNVDGLPNKKEQYKWDKYYCF